MFLRPKLAASYLRRGPKPEQKLAAAYFNRKKLSVYTNVRDLFEPWPIFTRINKCPYCYKFNQNGGR